MKNGIVVLGSVFVDIKGFPHDKYIPAGRNAGDVVIVHGGVARNIAEDIANFELRPTFVSTVDFSSQGTEVIRKLSRHKVNTEYMIQTENGMGIWLAIFDETGDVVGSISKRPDMKAFEDLVIRRGEEIFSECDSICLEIDLDKEIVKSVFRFAHSYSKKVYAAVSNMSIASERRDFLKQVDCFVCNRQEAEILFVESFENYSPEQLADVLADKIINAGISSMVVTLGSEGCVFADIEGKRGYCPARNVPVRDTTGAGDAFFAGVAAGLTYGCSLEKAVEIGTRVAASIVTVSENVCPRFRPEELGIDVSAGKQEFYGSDMPK